MRTTVTIDEELVRELTRIYGVKTKTQAVLRAIKEELRRAKLRKLASMLGKVDVDKDAWREGREGDIERSESLNEREARHG